MDGRFHGCAVAGGLAVFLAVAFPAPAAAIVFRTTTGADNNPVHALWGAAGEQLLRRTGNAYADGVSEPRGGSAGTLPSARAVSTAVLEQLGPIPNSVGASDWLWQWGQFLDHDLSLTGTASPAEPFNIAVPAGDLSFDPNSTGSKEIAFSRSDFDPATGTSAANPRQQVNELTAFIDASNVYGSDATRSAALRSTTGVGRLATSIGLNGEVLLPFNTHGLPNAMTTSPDLFLAGDVRANEQVGLTAVHTLFVREHNRLAADISQRLAAGEIGLLERRDAFIAMSGGLASDDDFVYQAARKVVGAEMQVITYQEWLPLLLGDDVLPAFTGFDANVDPGIANEFSTAAYRVGHTMLSPELQRRDASGMDLGAVDLRDAFFNPQLILEGGVDSLLMGLTYQPAQAVDPFIMDGVRNFLFGPPGAGGFDLAALNIQRGRDHGIGALNDVRAALGLAPYADFFALTGGDADLAAAFASVYADVDDVDLWAGGLAEPYVNGALVGETFHSILLDQFTRLRDGDSFFYMNPGEWQDLQVLAPQFEFTRLGDVIRRNTAMVSVQDNVFMMTSDEQVPEPAPMLLLAGIVFVFRSSRWGRR